VVGQGDGKWLGSRRRGGQGHTRNTKSMYTPARKRRSKAKKRGSDQVVRARTLQAGVQQPKTAQSARAGQKHMQAKTMKREQKHDNKYNQSSTPLIQAYASATSLTQDAAGRTIDRIDKGQEQWSGWHACVSRSYLQHLDLPPPASSPPMMVIESAPVAVTVFGNFWAI